MNEFQDKNKYAYDLLVHEHGDLVGYVAYGFYKKSKREWLMSSHRSDEERAKYYEMLTPQLVETYRSDAEHVLEEYAKAAIEAAKPSIESRAKDARVVQIINRKSGFWSQVWAGFTASVIVLFVTAMIAFALKNDIMSFIK
ncbi:hypothetical protein [Terasakiella sp. SH-1]|uniref:hypothetical protein n=1 Tax=Terasakiella sp. SH-1 TaxID=2560057 RepID=UPI001073ED65|nr:hypothetical protein [Terasakiella sp. SH-1]